MIGFKAGKGVVTNKEWSLEVKINATENGLIVRTFRKSTPDLATEINFTLGFYASFPKDSINPLT